jgi:hypothetical protein
MAFRARIHVCNRNHAAPVVLDCGAISISALKAARLNPGEIDVVFVSTFTATTSAGCRS